MEVIIAPGGRQAVANILARRFGPSVRLVHDPHGAPMLVGASEKISISHSRNFAALAIHPSQQIGVDIEEPRPQQLERIASRFLSPAELAAWNHDLLTPWTIKEAVFKAAGNPDMPIGAVTILSPGEALTPNGEHFRIESQVTPDYTLSTARRLLTIERELDELASASSADDIYRRATLHLKLGNHGAALSDFNRAAHLNPSGPAAAAAKGLRAILDFHLPLNP